MNTTPLLLWKTEAYDSEGNVIGIITKSIGGGTVMLGTADAFAQCLPELRQATAFFTDPDALARSAYEAYVRGFAHEHVTWDNIKNNESQSHHLALWKRIAQAVLTTPTTTTAP